MGLGVRCSVDSGVVWLQLADHQLGIGFPVWVWGFWVWVFGFRVSGFRLQVPGSEFQFSGFDFRVSGFGYRVSNFGFRVSVFGFGCRGLRGRGVVVVDAAHQLNHVIVVRVSHLKSLVLEG